MKELIQDLKQLVEDYGRRKISAKKLMDGEVGFEQYCRVSGKREVYSDIIMELKEVIAKHETKRVPQPDAETQEAQVRCKALYRHA